MSAEAKRLLKAADFKVYPGDMARQVYQEGSAQDLSWLLDFFEALVFHMADLEETQGGYRSVEEIHIADWCKRLKGYILTMEDEENAISGED